MGIIVKKEIILGISGQNWNIKLLSVSNAVSASVYWSKVTNTKKNCVGKFNEWGTGGALVVASNPSAGVRNQPLLINLFGVIWFIKIRYNLSAGASANDNVDVDVVGDLPKYVWKSILLL